MGEHEELSLCSRRLIGDGYKKKGQPSLPFLKGHLSYYATICGRGGKRRPGQ
jgi:hypothetical protein